MTDTAGAPSDIGALWKMIEEHEGKVFHTSKGLAFTYRVQSGRLFFSRKEKDVTRASVEKAFERAEELDWMVTGPKKLGVFGASYIHPLFLAFGVVSQEKEE